MADIGGGEPQQPGNEQGKGEEGDGAVGLSHDGLVVAMCGEVVIFALG